MTKRKPPQPDSYQITSISLYQADRDRLEMLLRHAKTKHNGWNKSALIRLALQRLRPSDIPSRPKI